MNNYNREYKYKKYNIVYDTLEINTCTATFSSKEKYYYAYENRTKLPTKQAVFNTLTV